LSHAAPPPPAADWHVLAVEPSTHFDAAVVADATLDSVAFLPLAIFWNGTLS
jgi:hypothetical protein